MEKKLGLYGKGGADYVSPVIEAAGFMVETGLCVSDAQTEKWEEETFEW